MSMSRTSFQFHFPSVLRRIAYDRQLKPDDRVSMVVSVEEALNLLRDYCRDMNLGVAYDERLREPWNTSAANSITTENLKVARLIHAQGFKDDDLADLIGQPIAALAAIPVDADLFATATHDQSAAELMAMLCGYRGIKAANATKLLHQKRPGLFPIFDSLVRRALGLSWPEVEGVAGYLQLLRQYRDVMLIEGNREAFNQIMERMGDAGTEPLAGKPPVRVLDALSWSVIYYCDPFFDLQRDGQSQQSRS